MTDASTPLARPGDTNAGKLAAEAWLSARGLQPTSKTWDVEVGLGIIAKRPTIEFDPRRDTRFHLHIYSEEWGYRFSHAGRASWIRVTDIAFVHGADDFRLLDATPALKNIGAVLRAFEAEHGLTFQRAHAAIISSALPGADDAVRKWIQAL